MTMREFVQTFTNSTSHETVLIPPEKTDLSFLPTELQEEITDNFMYFIEFGYEARDDPTVIHPTQVGGSSTWKLWNMADSSSSFSSLLSLERLASILPSNIGQRSWAPNRAVITHSGIHRLVQAHFHTLLLKIIASFLLPTSPVSLHETGGEEANLSESSSSSLLLFFFCVLEG